MYGPYGAALVGPLIPLDAEPEEAFGDARNGVGHEARTVSVFHADDELSADVACQQLIEERGADVPDVRHAGGAGRVARADVMGGVYRALVERSGAVVRAEESLWNGDDVRGWSWMLEGVHAADVVDERGDV